MYHILPWYIVSCTVLLLYIHIDLDAVLETEEVWIKDQLDSQILRGTSD